jgi:hypothetical protein
LIKKFAGRRDVALGLSRDEAIAAFDQQAADLPGT